MYVNVLPTQSVLSRWMHPCHYSLPLYFNTGGAETMNRGIYPCISVYTYTRNLSLDFLPETGATQMFLPWNVQVRNTGQPHGQVSTATTLLASGTQGCPFPPTPSSGGQRENSTTWTEYHYILGLSPSFGTDFTDTLKHTGFCQRNYSLYVLSIYLFSFCDV